MESVKITRRFIGRNNEFVDALSDDAWQALMVRIGEVAPMAIEPVTDGTGEHVKVTVANQRGAAGAFALHDLACRYGALAVVL